MARTKLFFDFWNLAPERVPECFPEFGNILCRYRNCGHEKDRDCGVRVAVEEGEIGKSRYKSYLKIREIIREKGVAFTPPRRRKR